MTGWGGSTLRQNTGNHPDPLAEREPVAWRCKDYGDGWIYYRNHQQAFDYAESTGCLIQGLVPVDLRLPE